VIANTGATCGLAGNGLAQLPQTPQLAGFCRPQFSHVRCMLILLKVRLVNQAALHNAS
jgi:hypothetical protein